MSEGHQRSFEAEKAIIMKFQYRLFTIELHLFSSRPFVHVELKHIAPFEYHV